MGVVTGSLSFRSGLMPRSNLSVSAALQARVTAVLQARAKRRKDKRRRQRMRFRMRSLLILTIFAALVFSLTPYFRARIERNLDAWAEWQEYKRKGGTSTQYDDTLMRYGVDLSATR